MKNYLLGLALLVATSLGLAQPQRVGAWSYGDLDNGLGLYAGTTNASGGFLVQQCYFEDDVCYWIMSSDATCQEKASYPALMNGPEGASPAELFCFKLGKEYRTAFKDFKLISIAVQNGGVLGVAVPMASGEFRVHRFDMAGGSAAVSAMNRRFADRAKKSTKSKSL